MFRMTFVFCVVHLFPLVVPQYFIRVRLCLKPSQNRTCAVNASGSQPSLVTNTPAAATSRSSRRPLRQTWYQRHGLHRGNQILQLHRTGQRVTFKVRVEVLPARRRVLRTAGQPAECQLHRGALITNQPWPVVVDTVVSVMVPELRIPRRPGWVPCLSLNTVPPDSDVLLDAGVPADGQWRRPRTKVKKIACAARTLVRLGVRLDFAIKHAISRKS